MKSPATETPFLKNEVSHKELNTSVRREPKLPPVFEGRNRILKRVYDVSRIRLKPNHK